MRKPIDKPKRGRPVTVGATVRMELLATPETAEILEELCKRLKLKRAAVIRDAIEFYSKSTPF